MRALQHLVLGLAISAISLVSVSAFSTEREPPADNKVLQPATRYSGGTPIDMSNGLLFNNGTFGAPNPEYEAWAKSATVVAGLSERPYSYSQKIQFVTILQEQVIWGESAIRNWKSTTNEFPDALAYSKAAVEKMQPELDKLKSTSDKANSSGDSGWTQAESEARRALIDFRITYMQMHKNVQARALK
jgi:hypothetical protein